MVTTTVVQSLLEAMLVLLLADAMSGVFHWLGDTFWTEETPVLGRLFVKPNRSHHQSPSAFVAHSWLKSSWDLLTLGMVILAVAWFSGSVSWQACFFVFVGVNANQVHKWNHLNVRRVPRPIRFLRNIGVLQSPAQHAVHHRGKRDTAYCVVTPFVNPVLDGIGFWRFLEWLVPGRRSAGRNGTFAS
jgi:hypothetical protein